MSRLDEVELVVTNNLARARARMTSANYNNLNEQVEIQNVENRESSEDEHLLSPRRVRRGCCSRLWSWCCGPKEYSSRTIWIGRGSFQKFPPNIIRNQKYNIFTFIPIVRPEMSQFQTFLNICSFSRFCSINSSFSSISSSC